MIAENDLIIKDTIVGSRNSKNYLSFLVFFFAGLGFFLAGLSSYLHINLLFFTETKQIIFLPQGIAMLFYGTGALGISFYLLLTIFWNIGSGYNEFSKKDNSIKIVRVGFPGQNRNLFLSYEFQNVKKLKFLLKQGLNPRYNLLLVLKDKREIPLFPAQSLLNPFVLEQKGLILAKYLNVPIENVKM